ncbi:hypothetical protein NP233_g12424 [Leucocoprinus birnbaumii]|uniref:F-box domain-containing protein n=1 Tax=Leucocoprinus birnbaumii TaxID=56174 RepID=A0AAD5VH22_9AGAR|nr:hypothetical protein NP233_g12424 [Leucocoprinus birnbaumii]
MPPRATKKAKTSTTGDKIIAAETSAGTRVESQGASNGDNGKCKFVEMPLELLFEVMSYFPAVQVPTSRRYNIPLLPPSVFERQDALRALSQTCKLWRTIFYPMLWERMEACAVRNLKLSAQSNSRNAELDLQKEIDEFRDIPPGWYKSISRSLERVCTGLSSDPQAAQHVRIVNFSLTRCSVNTVLPALIQCLENLPNLEILQILRAHSLMSPMLKSHFEGHTFPQVRTVVIPEHGHEVMRCCPNARKVICNYGDGSKIITGMTKFLKNVEVVEGILADKNFLKRLVKGCQNIRELKLERGVESDTTAIFNALAPLKKLTRLELHVNGNYAETYHTMPHIASIVKGGKNLLNNGVPGKKTFKLFHVPRYRNEKIWVLDVPV